VFGELRKQSFFGVVGAADSDDFFDLLDVRQTLRTLRFGEQIASSEVSPEGKIEPQQLYLKCRERCGEKLSRV
jgi:hypothetical protein